MQTQLLAMAAKRAAAAAADPPSSTEEDGDTSSGVSANSHEQEVADEERRGKESSPEESESESEEDASAAAEEVEVEEEGDEQSTDEGQAEPHPQPSSKRVDPAVTAALKEEVQDDVGLQPSKRVDPRAPVAKKQPQSNNSLARDRKRACCGENGKTASCETGKTAQHGDQTEPRLKRSRRAWAPGDEVLVLKALAQHRRENGELPTWGDCGFFESIRECLEVDSFHHFDVKDKARSLLRRYRSRVVPATDHDSLIHSLSRDVWGDLPPIVDYATAGSIDGNEEAEDVAAISEAENGGGRSDTKGFRKLCKMYPLLAQEVKLLAEVQPGHESAFTRLDAERALYMEKKLERVKYEELKFETRMVLEVHAPKAKVTKKLLSLLAKVSKNV